MGKQALLGLASLAIMGSWPGATSFEQYGSWKRLGCVPCEVLFTKIEWTPGGEGIQRVALQERGEPKTGTGFMYSWAEAALDFACDYLRSSFGNTSCKIEETGDPKYPGSERTMIFEPRTGDSDALCTCTTVKRVEISISRLRKHELPIQANSCTWVHGLDKDGSRCLSSDGRAVENYEDLWHCMHRVACNTTDDRLQMAIIRDPRPTVVSSYFHFLRHGNSDRIQGDTLDEYVLRVMPSICKHIAIRYILFGALMKDQSAFFWYERAHDRPLEWHRRWYLFVGLDLPPAVVERAALFAEDRKVELNGHPGGEEPVLSRSYEDELSPELIARLDNVLRVWLPYELREMYTVHA